MNGFLYMFRHRDTGGVYVETAEDMEDVLDVDVQRIIYCQAVSDVEMVQEKIRQWKEELDVEEGNINDRIADMVSSLQWIANEHTLQSFRPRHDQENQENEF